MVSGLFFVGSLDEATSWDPTGNDSHRRSKPLDLCPPRGLLTSTSTLFSLDNALRLRLTIWNPASLLESIISAKKKKPKTSRRGAQRPWMERNGREKKKEKQPTQHKTNRRKQTQNNNQNKQNKEQGGEGRERERERERENVSD